MAIQLIFVEYRAAWDGLAFSGISSIRKWLGYILPVLNGPKQKLIEL
jgi:hypothetical protein